MKSLENLHPTLQRQIKRNQIADSLFDDQSFEKFMNSISQAYHEADNDRYTIERTLEISSQEMRDLYQSLEEERRVIASVMSDGICIVDNHWNIIRINSEMERLLKNKSVDIENRHLFDYLKYRMSDENEHLNKARLESLIGETSNFHCEQGTIETPEHKNIYASFSINIIDKKKQKHEYLIIMHDITRQVEKENQLREAKNTAEKMSHIKSQFLANMSHEIRTPLNGIIGTTEILFNTCNVDACMPYYTIIMDSSKLLLSIVNDILDVTKMEYGEYTLLKSDCDFTHLFKNIMNMFGAFGSKDLKIQYSGINREPLWIQCDETRVKQILINLIGNAVKFTEAGAIDVDVSYEMLPGEDIKLSVAVRDTGPGIPDDKLAAIFDRFTQIEDATRKRHQGTGLGLSITKNLIELMDGKIFVESTLSVGSTFYFYIIVQKGNELTQNISPHQDISNRQESDQAALDVLVVEDNIVNQTIIKKQLENIHCHVTVASDEPSCMQALQENTFNIIFMDLHLPGITGIELTEKIRSQEKSNGTYTPIIACTSSNESEDKLHCLDAGMDDYLAKPYFQKTLYQLISRWCRIDNLSNEKPASKSISNKETKVCRDSSLSNHTNRPSDQIQKTTPIPADNHQHPVLRESDLHDFIHIDPTGNFLFELFDEYVKDTEKSIELLFNSKINNDTIVCHRICHSLKSSSATLGLARVSAICQELESDFSKSKTPIFPENIEQKIYSLKNEYSIAKEALVHYRERRNERR